MLDDFDDEDGPAVFKRSTASKSSKLHSDVRKSTSQSHDGRSFGKTSDVPSSNGQSSNLQKGKIVSSAKAPSVHSSVDISKTSSPHLKTYQMKSHKANAKSPSLGNIKKPLSENKTPIDVKEEKSSINHLTEDNNEDSDDDTPLSARLNMSNANAKKATTSPLNKSSSNGQSSSLQKSKLVSTSKASGVQSSVCISKVSTSNPKTYQVKSPIANSKLPSPGIKKEPFSEKKIPIDVKEENKSSKHLTRDNYDDSEDEDSDDDTPLSARLNMSNANAKKATTSPLNKSSSNGQSSSLQKSKLVSTSKASGVQSSVCISKVSTSNPKTYQVKSPIANSKLPSLGIQKEPFSEKKIPIDVKEENKSSKHLTRDNYDDSEDEDDDAPLSARLKKDNDNTRNATNSLPKKSSEYSDDDDVPLSANTTLKTNLGASNRNHDDSKKPISKLQKGQQYGSGSSVKQERPSTLSVKRPLDKIDSLHSSGKKSKLSDPASSVNAKKVSVKPEPKVEEDDDMDSIPISLRIKKSVTVVSKSYSSKKLTNVSKVNKGASPSFKKKGKFIKSGKKPDYSKSSNLPPGSGDGQKKWTTLVHNGVIFPPPYQPHGVKMLYKGRPVTLTPEQEEVATMFAVMRDTEYMQKQTFKDNFWNDWRKLLGKNHEIQNLKDCDFTPIYDWYQIEKEKKKQISSEEKKTLKEEKMKQEEKYMWAIVDGVKEKVGNFRVEPPGLFRGRGEHPKMGKLKRRIRPDDIVINIGKGAPIPECPIAGESWKEIRHDNTVTWLAYWLDPINPKLFKYVFLAASSSLKGQSDKEKYEKARKLKGYIGNIRAAYTKDFTSKDITKQQIAVATYLIDKLALRAGNEKDDDAADTVGCCTLKVENVTAEAPNKLQFSFLGKDSIKYENTVEVVLPVYNAILKFQKDKQPGDDLFDKLDTNILNAHLKELMPGLTAKVFRTYNASIILDDMLSKETKDGDVAEKFGVYQHANKQVAIICNHQRSVSKSHSAQMSRLTEKIDELQALLKELKTDLDRARKGKPPLKSSDGKTKRSLNPEAIKKKIDQTNAKIEKMQRDMEIKEDLKTVALGTSKINYLDPRITVAWCKRHEVPIEKIFNKSLLAKFGWAMDVDPDFRF